MSFDNIHIQIRGKSDKDLLTAIELALSIRGFKATGWYEDTEHGLVIQWCNPKNKFIQPLDAESIFPQIKFWLDKNEKEYDIMPRNTKIDMDGDIVKGWILYTQDWGDINGDHTAIFAVAPAYLWLGK